MTSRRLPLVAAVLTTVGVLGLLLVPREVDLPITWLASPHLLGSAAAGGTPLWWALEDLANVALFVPLGVVLARIAAPVPAVLLGGALSAACESAQQLIPARHGSVLDVAMNTLGAAVGVAVAIVVARRARSGSAHLRLAAGGALPEEPAVRGLADLHPLQAGRAVRHVEPRFVDRAAGLGQREVLPVTGPTAVAAHLPMVSPRSDARTPRIGGLR